MDGSPQMGCDNDHLGTSMPVGGAVHPITVIGEALPVAVNPLGDDVTV
jgi:hypothetical protein